MRPGRRSLTHVSGVSVDAFSFRPTHNTDPTAVYLDYLILGCFSIAMFVYAYVRRPGATSDDDNDGGLPVSGDGAPVDTPPAVVTPDGTLDRPPVHDPPTPVRDDTPVAA